VSAHPSPESLAAFAKGRTVDSTVAQHLDTCAECRRVVANAKTSDFSDRPPSAQTECLPAFAGYEVVRELGRGGMGVVYLARNTLMARDEVLKVVSHGLLANPAASERFLREMKAAAKLQHPNVVTAYTALREGDSLALAMEYVPGQDLAALVEARGPLPVANACYYAYQATAGLQHAHERGMVHRDIKPSNLILAKVDGRTVVKVLDFGLAKATLEKPETGLTAEGRMLGTPAYVAPEQAADAANADIRADIYSLGCTLFHLLAGHPPFRSDSWVKVVGMHQTAPVPSVADSRAGVPPGLAEVVANMMAKQPAARYQTPAEAGQALRPYFQPGKGKADAASTTSRIAVVAGLPPLTRGARPESLVAASPPRAEAAQPASRRREWVLPALVASIVAAVFLAAWAVEVYLARQPAESTLALVDLPDDAAVEVNGAAATVTRDAGRGDARIVARLGDVIEVKRGGARLGGRTVSVEDARAGRLIIEWAAPPGTTPAKVERVLGPEGSVWAGIGTFRDANGERMVGSTWRITERRGSAFKGLAHSGFGYKAMFEGAIGDDGRITLEAREPLEPVAMDREAVSGEGEIGKTRMSIRVEYPSGAESKLEFKLLPDGGDGFAFQGRWLCFQRPNNWRGTRRVTNESEFIDFNGAPGTWDRDGGLLSVHFAGNGQEWLIIDPDKPNELQGSNGQQTVTWVRQ
jgi:hypothetical protein